MNLKPNQEWSYYGQTILIVRLSRDSLMRQFARVQYNDGNNDSILITTLSRAYQKGQLKRIR